MGTHDGPRGEVRRMLQCAAVGAKE